MPRSLYARLTARFAPERSNAFTRRQLLKASLAAGGAMLLSNCMPVGSARRPVGKRVAVIGAGFAGLAAAHELTAAGYDVYVIDARKRIGGRVLTFHDFLPGLPVEGGGELVGSNHPVWVAYAERFKLPFRDVTEEEGHAPIMLNGKKLDAAMAEGLWEEMDAALAGLNALAKGVDGRRPWLSPQAAVLDSQTTAQWLAGLEASALVKEALAAQLVADNGVALGRQSLLGNLAQIQGGGVETYWTDSEVYRCAKGNGILAEALAKTLNADRLFLGVPVASVVVGSHEAIVTTADGRKLHADEVILTAPPTTWHKIIFAPSLPPGLKPQMGMNLKYLSEVKSRFWREDGLAPDSLSDGPVSMTWECSDNLDLAAAGGHAVLNAFAGGPHAMQILESATPDLLIQTHVQKLYPKFARSFIQARYMSWPKDPLTLGGYAFPAPGEIMAMGPVLHRPHEGRLHFAGEHTAYDFIGYMEGALASGVRAARGIAARDGVG